MEQQADPQWLTWAKRLQAISQTGLTFTRDHYDRQRYEELQAIAAEMMAAGSGMPESEKLLSLFRGEVGYATPKVEVRGAVVRDNEILLVREREDGGWTMPGGWADVGESPTAMVVREVKEESGFDVAPRKLAAVFDRNKHPHPPITSHAYKLYFVCELLGGEITPSFETPEVGFFSRNALPPLSATRITPYQIEHMFSMLSIRSGLLRLTKKHFQEGSAESRGAACRDARLSRPRLHGGQDEDGVILRPGCVLLRQRVAIFFGPGAVSRDCLQRWPTLRPAGAWPFRLGFRHALAGLCFQAGTDVNHVSFVLRLGLLAVGRRSLGASRRRNKG